jgi:hypothetical protein
MLLKLSYRNGPNFWKKMVEAVRSPLERNERKKFKKIHNAHYNAWLAEPAIATTVL